MILCRVWLIWCSILQCDYFIDINELSKIQFIKKQNQKDLIHMHHQKFNHSVIFKSSVYLDADNDSDFDEDIYNPQSSRESNNSSNILVYIKNVWNTQELKRRENARIFKTLALYMKQTTREEDKKDINNVDISFNDSNS